MYMYPCTWIEASALIIPFTFKDNTFNFCGKNRSHSSKGVNITCSRRFTKLMYLLQILFLELCEHASCGILVALHVRCVWQQLLLCTSQNQSITAQYMYTVLINPESNKHIVHLMSQRINPLECRNEIAWASCSVMLHQIACERCSDLLRRALYIVNALSLMS